MIWLTSKIPRFINCATSKTNKGWVTIKKVMFRRAEENMEISAEPRYLWSLIGGLKCKYCRIAKWLAQHNFSQQKKILFIHLFSLWFFDKVIFFKKIFVALGFHGLFFFWMAVTTFWLLSSEYLDLVSNFKITPTKPILAEQKPQFQNLQNSINSKVKSGDDENFDHHTGNYSCDTF